MVSLACFEQNVEKNFPKVKTETKRVGNKGEIARNVKRNEMK